MDSGSNCLDDYIVKVGFIGLGNMGGAVTRNIQRGGFDLIARDIEKANRVWGKLGRYTR